MSYNYADLFFCTTRNEITNILLTTNFQTLVTLAGTISNSPNHKTFNSHKAYTLYWTADSSSTDRQLGPTC